MVGFMKTYPRLQKMLRISYLTCLFNGKKYCNDVFIENRDFYRYKKSSCDELVKLVNIYFNDGNRFGFNVFLMRTWKKYKR